MAKQKEGKQRLNLNWKEIFPGEEVSILGSTVTIEPLGLQKLATITNKLKSLGADLSKAGITWDNYNQPNSLVGLASVILNSCPQVLSDASNIALEDIQRLPIEHLIKIIQKVIEVNSKSKDILEKNFESLAKTLASLMNSKVLEQSSKS